jgi:transketolase
MKYLKAEAIDELEDKAYRIRKLSLEMIAHSGWGHVGGSFSCAEILSCLYFHVLRVNPETPREVSRDYLIFSKAHASPALYAVLALKEFFPVEKIYTYCRLNGLDGHTNMLETPGVDCSGGSLGLGLSYAVGVSLGLKMKEQYHQRVYTLVGDGELNEGQIWEAAMAAAHYKLDNLILAVDYNKVSAKGFVSETMPVEPLLEKWRAFGWNVLESDGHDVQEICSVFYRAKYLEVNGRPTCIIMHTVKGKGLEECEFNYKWHTHAPSFEKAQSFLKELAERYDKPYEGFKWDAGKIEEGTLRQVIEGDGM